MVTVVGEDPAAKKRVTCRHCAAVLEYTQSEVKTVNGRDYSGGPDGKDYITCPRCNNEVTLRAW